MPHTTPTPIPELLRLAEAVAREAGSYARSVDPAALVLDEKTNQMDIVTQVDTRNERVIRETVLAQFPDHEFLGEEFGASAPSATASASDASQRVRWIIDPVDGTMNFAQGREGFAVIHNHRGESRQVRHLRQTLRHMSAAKNESTRLRNHRLHEHVQLSSADQAVVVSGVLSQAEIQVAWLFGVNYFARRVPDVGLHTAAADGAHDGTVLAD